MGIDGCGFDFAVLAQETGMVKECAELAINHVDLMLIVTFQKGYFLFSKKHLGVRRINNQLIKSTTSLS